MKFDPNITKEQRQTIDDALDTILNKGDKFHRFMIKTFLESEILVCAYPVAQVNASGITGITNPEKTNERIQSERLDLNEALKEVFITFASETLNGARGTEGTFVHEGRHAYDFARAVASFSNADNEEPFNPTLYELEWEAHQTAGNYMIQMGKEDYLEEGLDLFILGKLKDKYYVNDKGIKKRLKNSYGLVEGENVGPRVSEMVGLEMRSKGFFERLFD